MDEMLKEALRLRKLGFAIHWLRPKSKAPIADGWSATPAMTEAGLKASYSPGLNVGFRPGKWSVVAGKEVCVLDVDIRGGPAYADEAYAAAKAMLKSPMFTVISGSGIGRHTYLGFPPGKAPSASATTLRQSDVWVNKDSFEYCSKSADDARPAWLIELLSTGKNVVMPPSIHPDTGQPYQFDNE
jgi:hypothetical protein